MGSIFLQSTSKIPLSERFKLVQQTALIKKNIEPVARSRRQGVTTSASSSGGGIKAKNAVNRRPVLSRLAINKVNNPKQNKSQTNSRSSRQKPEIRNQRADQHMKNRGLNINNASTSNRQNRNRDQINRAQKQQPPARKPQRSNQSRINNRSTGQRPNQPRPVQQRLSQQRSTQLFKSKRLSNNNIKPNKSQTNRPAKKLAGKRNQSQVRSGQGPVRSRRGFKQNPRARNPRKKTDKGSLDKDLDTYMAKTRSQLDADLDAYMSSNN